MKGYDIIICKPNNKNIIIASKASCVDAIHALEEKVDPSLQSFVGDNRPNTKKLLRELAEEFESNNEGYTVLINEYYKYSDGWQ